MKANEIVEVLNQFKVSGYQKVLIDGDWGIGKTKYLLDFTTGNASSSCYISLFGKKDINSIMQELYFRIIENAPKGKFKKHLSTLREKTKALDVSAFGLSLSIPLIENLHNSLNKELNHKEEYIIVLDDLERKHDDLNIKEIFGLVDSLAKIKGIKLVLIAATERLSGNNILDFKDFKEKAIDRVYFIENYAEEAPEVIFGGEIWKVIAPIAKQLDFLNLRTFEKSKLFIHEVLSALEQELFTNKFTRDDVYKMCFATVFFNIEHQGDMKLLDTTNADEQGRILQDAMYKDGERGVVEYLYNQILKNNLDNDLNKTTLKHINRWFKTGSYSKSELIDHITFINNYKETTLNFYSSEYEILQMIDYTREYLRSLNGHEPLAEIIPNISSALVWCDVLSIDFEISTDEIITLINRNIINHIDIETTSFRNQDFLGYYEDNTLVKDMINKIQLVVEQEYYKQLIDSIFDCFQQQTYELTYLRQFYESIISITEKSVRDYILDRIKRNNFLFPIPIGQITPDQWFWCLLINNTMKDIQDHWNHENLYEEFKSTITNIEENPSKLLQHRLKLLFERY